MIARMRNSWRQFERSKPGRRFQDRYNRRQQNSSGKFNLSKVLYIVGGLLIAVTSLALAPLPGPGWGTFFIGLGLLAGEFKLIARFLDWAEVRLRGAGRWARGVWARSSTAVRVLICVVAVACAAALVYGAYSLFFGS